MSETPEQQELHWLVRKSTIRKLWWGGGVVLAALAVGDVGVHGHAAFAIDGTFAFYAWYGLGSCVAMVLFAKVLGWVLKRPDSYYEDRDHDV